MTNTSASRTATVEAALHDLEQLVVGDLVLQVSPPSDRKTIEIVVERDASLTIKAPPTATVHRPSSSLSPNKAGSTANSPIRTP